VHIRWQRTGRSARHFTPLSGEFSGVCLGELNIVRLQRPGARGSRSRVRIHGSDDLPTGDGAHLLHDLGFRWPFQRGRECWSLQDDVRRPDNAGISSFMPTQKCTEEHYRAVMRLTSCPCCLEFKRSWRRCGRRGAAQLSTRAPRRESPEHPPPLLMLRPSRPLPA
jgi:hypothetical protein